MILPLGVSSAARWRVAVTAVQWPGARFCLPFVEPVASFAGIGIHSHFYSSRWRSVQLEGRLGSSLVIGEQHFYTGLIDWDSPEVRKTSRRRSAMPLERRSTDSP
ncbi:hypothetical protein JCGZ_17460 [Jatropha curcas]|uniref:Uncharacterized protein n=1 Tax=Jatropha curcas TaxID=180498 RepID=A0A067LD18_JATCU|nr:hypothetical protein JCGZ_17460 [Jatropha curcas]